MPLAGDNILFLFTQAGTAGSALRGRTPGAVGHQPTLATEWRLCKNAFDGAERLEYVGSSSYVPADELTDLASATTVARATQNCLQDYSLLKTYGGR